MTQDELRALALSMPEAEERSHFDHPDFRVRNKIFATLWSDGTHAVLKLDVEEMLTLVELDARAFEPASSRGGWTKIDLTRVKRAQIEPLVRAAWRTVAPKRLIAAHEGATAPKPTARRKRPR